MFRIVSFYKLKIFEIFLLFYPFSLLTWISICIRRALSLWISVWLMLWAKVSLGPIMKASSKETGEYEGLYKGQCWKYHPPVIQPCLILSKLLTFRLSHQNKTCSSISLNMLLGWVGANISVIQQPHNHQRSVIKAVT